MNEAECVWFESAHAHDNVRWIVNSEFAGLDRRASFSSLLPIVGPLSQKMNVRNCEITRRRPMGVELRHRSAIARSRAPAPQPMSLPEVARVAHARKDRQVSRDVVARAQSGRQSPDEHAFVKLTQDAAVVHSRPAIQPPEIYTSLFIRNGSIEKRNTKCFVDIEPWPIAVTQLMPLPTIGGGYIMFSGRTAGYPLVCCPSVNTYFALLSKRISIKQVQQIFIIWVEIAENFSRSEVKGQGHIVQMCERYNVGGIHLTAWRRCLRVIAISVFVRSVNWFAVCVLKTMSRVGQLSWVKREFWSECVRV